MTPQYCSSLVADHASIFRRCNSRFVQTLSTLTLSSAESDQRGRSKSKPVGRDHWDNIVRDETSVIYLLSCTISKLWLSLVKFSLATGVASL